MICPQCRSAECFRSHRGGAGDFLATFVGLRPWRCRACDKRFYAWTVAIPFARYARERVDAGTLIFLKRFLGFSPYRCDPCRQKFFSILPHRKIVPSMIGEDSRKIPVA
jgi:hypothetical protein